MRYEAIEVTIRRYGATEVTPYEVRSYRGDNVGGTEL